MITHVYECMYYVKVNAISMSTHDSCIMHVLYVHWDSSSLTYKLQHMYMIYIHTETCLCVQYTDIS